MKKRIFLTLVVLGTLIIQYITIKEEFFTDYSYLRYGVVIKKNDYIETTKHKSTYTSHNERTFIIKWFDNNVIDEIDVTANTFFTTNVGDNVAFTQTHKENMLKNRYPITFVIMLMISFIAVFVEAVFICLYLFYVIAFYIFDVEKPLK